MTWKSKLSLGILTALCMMLLTFALPDIRAKRSASAVSCNRWSGAIFMLLFVKLK